MAFWPITHLAGLVRTRQVTATELTTMYVARLKRYNPTLNCVVSLTEELGLEQAAQADREIATGQYRGPLHGIPWGCKDIIAVPGYRTTWGSGAFKDQVIDTEASVVRLLREAGAVLVAKLATGELAGGHHWFGGRTNNPWTPVRGRADRRLAPPLPRRPDSWRSASERRPTVRSSIRPRCAGLPVSGRRSDA